MYARGGWHHGHGVRRGRPSGTGASPARHDVGRPASGTARHVLRHVSQREAQDGRIDARPDGCRPHSRRRGGVGKSHPEAAGGTDAADRPVPARSRHGRPGRLDAGGGARPRSRGLPRPWTANPSPPEPHGVWERDPGFVGAGGRCRLVAAAGRFQLRLRQHRRGPQYFPLHVGALPVSSFENKPCRDRGSVDVAHGRDLQCCPRSLAGPPP